MTEAEERILESTKGEKCTYESYPRIRCNKIIDEKDIEEIKDLHPGYPISQYQNPGEPHMEPICAECYVEWFEKKDFEGDYNLLHPDETIDEFEDHED
ncbi:MAG: hypothetical protein ACOCUF_04135 [Patescibacteria group bacterium]